MIRPVVVRRVSIGSGKPKICVPIVGKTESEILEQAHNLRDIPHDLVEWRADLFDGVCDNTRVQETAHALREALGECVPLLFTFRTQREGGERALDLDDYLELNTRIVQEQLADLIDLELFSGDAPIRKLVQMAHQKHVFVVISNHDFQKTPSAEEIIRRLCQAQQLGGDILKLAAMPRNARDVLTLLDATERMYTQYALRPLITMSMGGQGMVSRLSGELFGSAVTFGSAGQASAPGQLDAQRLDELLTFFHG